MLMKIVYRWDEVQSYVLIEDKYSATHTHAHTMMRTHNTLKITEMNENNN